MPEQLPQVGQAFSSIRRMSSSETLSLTESLIALIRSSVRTVPSVSVVFPASIGPPETKIVGMLIRRAAISMPGVILSQLEMQTRASAQCAWTMYSTLSAIRSRDGREYSMPPWPIAMPSSTAIVLNSRGTAPADLTASLTIRPTGWRWVCPGTNSVKEFATAMIGLPMSSLATPDARIRARAPAMFRPWVTVRDLSSGIAAHSFSVVAVPEPTHRGLREQLAPLASTVAVIVMSTVRRQRGRGFLRPPSSRSAVPRAARPGSRWCRRDRPRD